MRKKIYDIKPPKIKKQEHEAAAAVKKSAAKKPKEKVVPVVTRKKERKLGWVLVSGAVLVVVLVAGWFALYKLPRADVNIWPKLEVMSFQETVKADSKTTTASVDTIPAYYFETEKSVSENFPATGNASNEGIAGGLVTIYNKSSSSIALRASTRLISDTGLLFLTEDKVTVPAATKAGSKVTPGSVAVKVKAAESGKNYNIGPSTFSIPGFKGTTAYFDVYAQSVQAMTGGFTGDVKKVTDSDIQTAKDMLSKKATDGAKDDLQKKYGKDYLLVDDSYNPTVTFDDNQANVGDVKPEFSLTGKAHTGILVVKKSDLDTFIKNNVLSQLPQDKSVLESSIKEDYSLSDVDFAAKKMTVSMNISTQVYHTIDKDSLSLSLLGENADQINQSVNNALGNNVAKITTRFWPFWVSSSPNNQKAVNIHIKFE